MGVNVYKMEEVYSWLGYMWLFVYSLSCCSLCKYLEIDSKLSTTTDSLELTKDVYLLGILAA